MVRLVHDTLMPVMKTHLKNSIAALVTIVTFYSCSQPRILETGTFRLGIGGDGSITQLTDKTTGHDYLAPKVNSPLLSIKKGGKLHEPSSVSVTGSELTFSFRELNLSARVNAEEKGTYMTFELTELSDTGGIELILWGPVKTSIGRTIGETIGVVRDTSFAIGIQALNPKTLGGYPENDDDSFTGYDIFATTSLVDVADSVNILYRGNTAKPESYGSSLNAYTRARNRERIVSSMQNDRYTAPSFSDGGLIGSKVAIFGCRPDEVLSVIENIELTEGLPHPELDGVWAKRSPRAVSAYLIQDFTPENYREAIELTRKAGLKYLYHGEPFSNWGHFDLRNKMTWDDLAKIVDEAEAVGIRVGAHTLSNFITTNDPYVTPVPDKRLAKVGTSSLVSAISADDTEIRIADPGFFNQMKNNTLHAVMIENELIVYGRVTDSQPWILEECTRGAFGTSASAHEKGSPVSKLADHAYRTFLTDNELSAEVSARIADLYNKTGLKQISFDGLEGNSSTGMGKYGELLFVKGWYDKLSPEVKNDYIMDASTPGHYFWHMFTRMNWGEPWYAGFRESQTEYRLLNQDYFRRNFIPCMLGWFSMKPATSIEDIEWMLARSAAFDAGYALVTSAEIVKKNGSGEAILEKIREWEKARMSGAFSASQKKRMENIKKEFTLLPAGDGSWSLIPWEINRFEHKYRELQPGQPSSEEFIFSNPYNKQSIGFIITVREEPVADIYIEIDNSAKTMLPLTLNPGESVKYQGGDEAIHYSPSWQVLNRIRVDGKSLQMGTGQHKITADCEFKGERKGILKLEIKTAGDAEKVISNN